MEPTVALVAGSDRDFLVHTKHTCDACFVQPILGKRYTAGSRSNFDLCARCFEAYRGPDIGLEETALVRDKKHSRDFALKLNIDSGGNVQIRRLKVSEIWDKSTSGLSFSNLMSVASGHILPKDKDGDALDAFIAKAKVTYVDGDGDHITVSSDAELEDAFLQAVKEFPACTPFRITVAVPRRCPKTFGAPRFCGVAVGKGPGMVRCRHSKKTEQNEKKEDSPVAAEGRPKVPPVSTPREFEKDFFVHARHTCDGCSKSPIVGTRYRATKIPNFDLCGTCFEKYEGVKDLDFKPEIHDGDRLMQPVWLMSQLKKAPKMANHVPGACIQSNGDLFDILKSIKEFTDNVASAAKAKPEQTPKPGQESTKSPAAEKPKEAPKKKQETTSTAEVIGRTLDAAVQEIEKAVAGEMKTANHVRAATPSNGKESPPKSDGSRTVEEDVAVGIADFVSIASSVVSHVTDALKSTNDAKKAEDDSRDNKMQSKMDDDVLNHAEGVAASTDVPSLAVGATVAEPGCGAKEIPSLEMPKVADASDAGDWSIVSDDEPQVKHDENTADESVSSTEPLAPVLLAKYDTELFQLHELGFLDDRKNIDAMECLEASHLGSDSTEKVTVQNVVEHLLGKRT